MVNEMRVPSFGEDLIGIDTSIESPTELESIKIKFAELAELVKKSYELERSPVKSLLFDHAIGELVAAELAVTKVLTYKPWASEG
jgi:hypothetical protein